MIPIAKPFIGEKEITYTTDAVQSGWISSHGEYISRFEEKLQSYLKTKNITTVSNGTVALHLALVALGIGVGDEVIVPSSSFIATLNAVLYTGATPVFVDIEENTWGMDPAQIEDAITENTKAVIVVHLYGRACNVNQIKNITQKYGIFLIEDNAEAFGGTLDEVMLGTIGDFGTFSFFGNKIITTGEGGAIFAKDDEMFKKIIEYKNHGMSPEKKYYHKNIGYNYRMTNMQAAIGLAQIEQIEIFLTKRLEIEAWYNEFLNGNIVTQKTLQNSTHVNWMYTVLIQKKAVSVEDMIIKLKDAGIDTRRVFMPMNKMPYIHKNIQNIDFKIATMIHDRGISLPTYYELEKEQVKFISREFMKCLQ